MSRKQMRKCDYEEMTNDVGSQSEPQEYYDEPLRNEYENTRKGYKPDAWNWSGMNKGK
jgi:hypothetical protein